jgi:hypothetical protein
LFVIYLKELESMILLLKGNFTMIIKQ